MTHLPRINAIATCVPQYELTQSEIASFCTELFSSKSTWFNRLLPSYLNAQIDRRYICKPPDWYLEAHSFSERNRSFVEIALDLIEETALKCLALAKLPAKAIGGLVVVSSTGLATPSLDALLIERMQLSRDIRRLPVFGLGCAGGVLGLARAASMVMAEPGLRVMLLVVELCSLTFQRDDRSKKNIISTALFGDGAAGVIVSCEGDGPAITGWGEHTWPNSLDIMGWNFMDSGFHVVMSRNIPQFVKQEMASAVKQFLETKELTIDDVDVHVPHPGGAKVLSALEDTFALSEGSLVYSREILREYGNMSAATVIFVLERTLAKTDQRGRFLMSSLGPGFTAAFGLLQR